MKRFKSRYILLSSVLSLSLLLSACSTPSTDDTSTDTSSKTEVTESKDSKDDSEKSSGTRVVVDQTGTEVELPENVERIADFWHANNQVVLLLGGGDKLVTTTEAIKGLPWFAKVYPRINEVPALVKGHDFNVEELIAENPDVVIVANHEQAETVRSAGLKAVEVTFQNFDELKETVNITAKVIGPDAEKRAKEYTDYLDVNIKYVEDKLKDIKDEDKPKVLHIAGGEELTKIDGAKSMIGAWMDVSGSVNSISDEANLATITLEEIIESNPDIIIIGGTQSKEGIDKIKNDPAWADVTAVKEDKLIRNPVGTFNWDRYSAEEALQILWAAKLFHPDKFEDLDMVEKTKEFYKKFYEYDLTDDEADRILAGDPPA